MAELIKQRLVGMLIVVIAGVIFIPDLLDGKKELVKEEFKKIPDKPLVEQKPVVTDFPKQKVTKAVESAKSISDEVADDAVVTAAPENKPQSQLSGQEPKNNSRLENKNQAEQTAVVTEEPNATLNADKSTRQIKPQPVAFEKSAWVLRLGTFRNKPNVDALLSKLEEAGVTTFVKPVEAKAGTLYRVFVGPELDKSSLEDAQKTLKTLTGLDGKITQFEPVN